MLSFLLESHIRAKFAAGSPQQQKHSPDRFKCCSFSTPEMLCDLLSRDFVCQTGTSTRIGESKKGIYLYFLGSPVSKSTLAGWWWLETWIFLVHISVISSSQLTNSYFSEGLLYHQPVIIQYFQIYNPLHQEKNNSNGMISYFAGSSTTKQSPNFHGISLGQRKKRTAFCSILVHVGELTHLWNIIILIGKSTLNGGAMLVYQPVKYVS